MPRKHKQSDVFEWVRPCLRETPHATYYNSLQACTSIGGSFTISVGDVVLLHSLDEEPFLGKVDSMYEMKDGSRKICTRWFFRQRDIPQELKDRHPELCEKDVFMSNMRDTNDLVTIESKCTVGMIYTDEDENRLDEIADTHTYICRFQFVPKKTGSVFLRLNPRTTKRTAAKAAKDMKRKHVSLKPRRELPQRNARPPQFSTSLEHEIEMISSMTQAAQDADIDTHDTHTHTDTHTYTDTHSQVSSDIITEPQQASSVSSVSKKPRLMDEPDTHTHTHMHADQDTYIHTRMHADEDTYIRTHMHADEDTYTPPHMHILDGEDEDTYTHTYIHTEANVQNDAGLGFAEGDSSWNRGIVEDEVETLYRGDDSVDNQVETIYPSYVQRGDDSVDGQVETHDPLSYVQRGDDSLDDQVEILDRDDGEDVFSADEQDDKESLMNTNNTAVEEEHSSSEGTGSSITSRINMPVAIRQSSADLEMDVVNKSLTDDYFTRLWRLKSRGLPRLGDEYQLQVQPFQPLRELDTNMDVAAATLVWQPLSDENILDRYLRQARGVVEQEVKGQLKCMTSPRAQDDEQGTHTDTDTDDVPELPVFDMNIMCVDGSLVLLSADCESFFMRILHEHNNDVALAIAHLKTRADVSALVTIWSPEEQQRFSEYHKIHGENLVQIKRKLTHKTMHEVIDYYYRYIYPSHQLSNVIRSPQRERRPRVGASKKRDAAEDAKMTQQLQMHALHFLKKAREFHDDVAFHQLLSSLLEYQREVIDVTQLIVRIQSLCSRASSNSCNETFAEFCNFLPRAYKDTVLSQALP